MPTPAIQTVINRGAAGAMAPSNVNYVDGAPHTRTYRQAPAVLRIESSYNSGLWQEGGVLDWSVITRALDGGDITATLIARGLDVENLYQDSLGDLVEQLDGDRRVRIVRSAGDADKRIMFQGYIQPLTLQWQPSGQPLTVTCIDQGQERIRTDPAAQILGRRMRKRPLDEWDANQPDDVEITGLPCTFNAGGRPNRTVKRYDVMDRQGNTRKVGLFTADGDPAAVYWSYLDALRYIVYYYVERPGYGVSGRELLTDTVPLVAEPPRPYSSDPFVRYITARMGELSCQSMSVDEALAVLCDASGLHYHVAARTAGTEPNWTYESYIRVLGIIETPSDTRPDTLMSRTRLMGVPNVRAIPRHRPYGTDASALVSATRIRAAALRSAAQTAALTIDRRRVDSPVFLGGRRRYEMTVLLRPWWQPVMHLDEVDQTEASGEIDQAVAFWDAHFADEYGDEHRVPTSPFHSLHPLHHTGYVTGLRGATVPTADVFRRWGFADDPATDAAGLARIEHQWIEHWAEWAYRVYAPDAGNPAGDPLDVLMYANAEYGAGLRPSVVRDWIPRRRPFVERISRESDSTTDLTPIVEIHFGMRTTGGDYLRTRPPANDAGWTRYAGALEIDADRAAIRLTEGNIWRAVPMLEDPDDPDGMCAMQAYIEGHFWVRVTACVEGDVRLLYAVDPIVTSGRRRALVCDHGYDRYVVRARDSANSTLAARAETDPRYDSVDQTGEFRAAGEALRSVYDAVRVAGDFETFFLDDQYRPGDSFSGCDGIPVNFTVFPWAKAVQHRNSSGGLRTRVILTDARANPELGEE